MDLLQGLVANGGTIEVFPTDFPCAIHQVLAMPPAKPRMLQANITRSAFILAAVGVEVIVIVWLMNLCQERLLTVMGGVPEAIPIMEVEPEEFNFDGNLHDDM